MAFQKNIKYKQVTRISLFGDDDIFINNSQSEYDCTGLNTTTNSKRIRFNLNNSLSDVRLSQNARCIVESCGVPGLTNMLSKSILLRLVVSTQDKTCDTKKFLNGNPIILSMAIGSDIAIPNVLYNASEFFYNINIPTNFLSNGYIDMELECPSASTSITFTGGVLSNFYINLIIVDEDMEITNDNILAPPIDYKNYNNNFPIKQY